MQLFSDKNNSHDKDSYILAKFLNFVSKNCSFFMITKARIKLIKSLEQRKQRNLHHLFVAEGPKLVGELLATMQPAYVAALPEWWKENKSKVKSDCEADTITAEELQKTSLLRTPQQVIALFPIPEYKFEAETAHKELCLALDGVQDPGNIGTILRIADWFGIHNVICSEDTADVYNPKAVQATMGALARVQVHYTNLEETFRQSKTPIYGTLWMGRISTSRNLAITASLLWAMKGMDFPLPSGILSHRNYLSPIIP